jgi:GNAT superfamily N-acetyltransferase
MEEVTVRLATVADVPVLVQMRAAFLAEVMEANPADPALLEALEKYFSTAVPAGEFVAYLAVAEGQVVGTSGLVYHRHPPSPRNLTACEAYVMNMYTLPAWRGRGIAATLLDHLLVLAREHGCSRVALHAMAKATPLYQRAGFKPVHGEMRVELH